MREPTKRSLTMKLDKICGEIIRNQGKCCRCAKTDNLQAAHIFSRKNRSVRWDLQNILCLCAGCHFWAHDNPILFAEFVRERYGTGQYLALKRRAKAIKKWTLEEMEEHLIHLKMLYAD